MDEEIAQLAFQQQEQESRLAMLRQMHAERITQRKREDAAGSKKNKISEGPATHQIQKQESFPPQTTSEERQLSNPEGKPHSSEKRVEQPPQSAEDGDRDDEMAQQLDVEVPEHVDPDAEVQSQQ